MFSLEILHDIFHIEIIYSNDVLKYVFVNDHDFDMYLHIPDIESYVHLYDFADDELNFLFSQMMMYNFHNYIEMVSTRITYKETGLGGRR